jgi:hypothetical protein
MERHHRTVTPNLHLHDNDDWNAYDSLDINEDILLLLLCITSCELDISHSPDLEDIALTA